MAIVSIATLKTYFETGDFPTQAQFEDLIDTLSASGILSGSAVALTATGTNQATALALTKAINRLDTVAASTGAKAGVTATPGFKQTIQNNGANDVVYYPFLGNNIYVVGTGALAANAGVTIAPGNQITAYCYEGDTGQITLI